MQDEAQDVVYETEDVSIEKVDVISRFEDFRARGFFDSIVDEDTARRAITDVEVLEKRLKDADAFGQMASEFCKLEALTYIEIAKYEGAEGRLSPAKQRLVNWIRSKSANEMREIMEEVSAGIRISIIERRENKKCGESVRENGIIAECSRISSDIVDELTTVGHTSLNQASFLERWQSSYDPDMKTIKAYTEKTRDALLRKEGRGLGDGSGTYMLVSRCDRNQVSKIVKTRLESIVADLRTLKQICKDTGFVLPDSGIEIIVGIVQSMGSTDLDLDLSA